MVPTLDFRNTNSLWCSILAETLARCGVRQAVCSPGSRSAALTVALAAHPSIEALPVLDERSAGFIALGMARRSGVPTVLVCTSGSAAANYWPAVVEAQAAQIPLLVITADRPPELRACTSGQTIDQVKLFGSYSVHQVELAVPEATVKALAYLRQTIAFAVRRSLGPIAGPVHLNAPFRDPLAPIPDGTTESVRGLIDDFFFAGVVSIAEISTPTQRLKVPGTRGLLIAGTPSAGTNEADEAALAVMQRATGWPLLADPLSNLRGSGSLNTSPITAYDAFLRSENARAALCPDSVVLVGAWPTSKVLRAWIQECDPQVLVIAPGGENRDALHARTHHVFARARDVELEAESPFDAAYGEAWVEAEAKARQILDVALASEERLFEPKALWLLARALKAPGQLFVANSMPVRDAEYVMPFQRNGLRLHCNRGANGIDGNVSTAIGLAHGGAPTVAVIGDLAFLHDSNALLSAPRLCGSLCLVVVNNHGGGIFEHLPIATADVPFRDFFLTPQSTDIGRLCVAHGVPYQRLESWSDFVRETSRHELGLRVLEIETNGKRDAEQRKLLFSEVTRH
jgi:2-succinyl-5-enolpyruvyl-6-hydroxy-3-cyclohexene-1-carboxylate synthase